MYDAYLRGNIDNPGAVEFLGGKRLMFAAAFWMDGSTRVLLPNVDGNKVSICPEDPGICKHLFSKEESGEGIPIYYTFDMKTSKYRLFLRDLAWSGDEFEIVANDRNVELQQHDVSRPHCSPKDIDDVEVANSLGGQRLLVAVAFLNDRTMQVFRPISERNKVSVRPCDSAISRSVKDLVDRSAGKSLLEWLAYDSQNARFAFYYDPRKSVIAYKWSGFCSAGLCVSLKKEPDYA